MTESRLTRSPTCAFATPATPVMGETIFVQPRSSLAFSREAWAVSTFARDVLSFVSASSSSCWLIAFEAASGRYRLTVVSAFVSVAWYWASWPFAWSYVAWNWRGSISKSVSPALTTNPSRYVCRST